MKKIFIIATLLFFYQLPAQSETTRFLDFKFILNQSDAGKKAQDFLKNKLEKGLNSIKKKEEKIVEEEKKIIQQKKIISPEDYKKKVSELRSKVSLLQKERSNLLQSVASQRSNAKNILLKNLNPIIKDYMQEKQIRIVLDKKSLLLADDSLNITNDIMILLNKKLKTISLK